MDTYLCMLYVSIEQEKALKKFFLDNGWKYRKPDPTHYTDQIGPIDLETSLKEESSPLKVKLGAKKRPVQSVSLKAKRRKGKNKSDIEDVYSNPIIEIVNDNDHEVKDIGYNDDDGDDDDDFNDETQQDVSDKQHVSKLDGTVGDASCQTSCYGNDDDNMDDDVDNDDDEVIGSTVEALMLDQKEMRFQCGKCLHYFTARKQLTDHLITNTGLDECMANMGKDSVTVKEVIRVVKKENDDDDDNIDNTEMVNDNNENCAESVGDNKTVAENVANAFNENASIVLSGNENMSVGLTENATITKGGNVNLQTKDNKPHLCNTCHLSFISDYLLKLHKHENHGGEPEDRMMLRCDECPLILLGTGWYIAHKKKVHNVTVSFQQKLFPCDICQQMFTRKDTLKDHVDVVHLKNKKRRARTKPTEKKFVCDTCGSLFLHKSHLNEHIGWKHNGTGKRHVCEDCGKEFLRPYALEYHRNKAHLKSKPYQCETCDKTYHTERSLRRHKEICQMDEEKKINCDLCGKKFSSLYNYNMHIDAIHSQKPFECECGTVVKWKSSMAKHKRRCILSGNNQKSSPFQSQTKPDKDIANPIRIRKGHQANVDPSGAFFVDNMNIDADNTSFITIPADTDELSVNSAVKNAIKEAKLLTEDQIESALHIDSSNVTIGDDGTAQSVYYVIMKE